MSPFEIIFILFNKVAFIDEIQKYPELLIEFR